MGAEKEERKTYWADKKGLLDRFYIYLRETLQRKSRDKKKNRGYTILSPYSTIVELDKGVEKLQKTLEETDQKEQREATTTIFIPLVLNFIFFIV